MSLWWMRWEAKKMPLALELMLAPPLAKVAMAGSSWCLPIWAMGRRPHSWLFALVVADSPCRIGDANQEEVAVEIDVVAAPAHGHHCDSKLLESPDGPWSLRL